jgi:caffeoyl-CoA O-methyltransferase
MEHIVSPAIEQYAVEHTTPEPDYFAALATETHERTSAPGMMVGTLEGRLLSALVSMLRPQRVLEIGTFTGYSALSMAEALPPGARIITCDINERHVEIAREHIARSPYADVIEIRLGDARDTVKTLEGLFDFVFIDADKTGYLAYYEAVLPKLSPQGVIAVDNVLWSGRVLTDTDADADGGHADADTAALRAFNDHVVADQRVECVMLTVRDGLSLIRRRSQS